MADPQDPESKAAATLVAQGLPLHQAGRLDEARQLYETALAIAPDHFDALHMLGVLWIQAGQVERGAELIAAAVRVNPNAPAAHANLANALNRLGRHQEAISSAVQAIALNPGQADAHSQQALALYQLGRRSDALACYRRMTALAPGDVQAHFNQAAVLRELGRPDGALTSFDRVVALKPDYAEAHRARGVVLHELGRTREAVASHAQAIALAPGFAEAHYDQGTALLSLGLAQDALASFDRAITLRSAYAEAYNNRGGALSALERHEEALASYDRAIALKPDYAEAWSNRAVPLGELLRPDEALQSCEQAVALKPDYAEAHNNCASVLHGFRRLEEVVAACDQALALNPDFADAHNNRGLTLLELRRCDEAAASFARAVALKPDYAEAHYNLSLCQLMLGDYAKGWAGYEWRWRTRQFREMRREMVAPLWLGGEPLQGKTILLHAEQGLGDTLQFCRFAPKVAALGARVVLEVQPGLERLMASLEGVDQIVVRGQPLPRCDYQTPLLSLPLAVGGELDPGDVPYLSIDPELSAAWASKLAGFAGLRVGLCWAGGMRPNERIANDIDGRRSLALEAFAPLARVAGATFYTLQKGPPAAQLAEALEHNWDGPPTVDLTANLKDFADTAAMVANLDLIITCDTSVAHLAGAMGRPVWVLNRFDACWRWLTERPDSPWYPSARLFWQGARGDWAGVVDEVARELGALAAVAQRQSA